MKQIITQLYYLLVFNFYIYEQSGNWIVDLGNDGQPSGVFTHQD